MVTDQQVRRLMKLNQSETLTVASAKAGMCENTAQKYTELGKLPSQCKKERTWRTRDDPFEEVWGAVHEKLEANPGFEAKTLFEWLQRAHPGEFGDGQLRTLQRKIKQWRALEGPAREIYFDQKHHPGRLCQSDFTHVTPLGVTISGEPFRHLMYHFVLTWSNWETGTICFSESFESLCTGLQNALWELGGVPETHRTDRLSAAVQSLGKTEAEFTRRYQALMRHYGLGAQKIRAGRANENGDVEQRHHRFKRALEQSLLLRESRDFDSRTEYEEFLHKLFAQLNAGRRDRFSEELKTLKSLPAKRLDDHTVFTARVGPGSTVRIQKKVYSVHSRLIGEKVKVRLYADYLEVWYAQNRIETIPRIRGGRKHHIQYRHVIDWLVRKPGAFENYRYRQDLFPSGRFKMAYDFLKDRNPSVANREYLRILKLSARESETGVEEALGRLIDNDLPITFEAVEAAVMTNRFIPRITEIEIDEVDLKRYDTLLEAEVCQ